MDPGTIAGITIGAVVGTVILGNVGRNIHVTRKNRDHDRRRENDASIALSRIATSFTRGNRGTMNHFNDSVFKGSHYADPTARGRRNRRSSKKTRKQNKKTL